MPPRRRARTRGRCGARRSRATRYSASAPSLSAAQKSIPVDCAAFVHRVQPGDRERPTEPGALRAGIDTDHVDLAERRDRARAAACCFSQLKPASPSRVEREEEQRRVEPRLGHAAAQRRFVPAALIGVLGERAVVHARATRRRRDRARSSVPRCRPARRAAAVDGERCAHLEQRSASVGSPRPAKVVSSASVAPRIQHVSRPPPWSRDVLHAPRRARPG